LPARIFCFYPGNLAGYRANRRCPYISSGPGPPTPGFDNRPPLQDRKDFDSLDSFWYYLVPWHLFKKQQFSQYFYQVDGMIYDTKTMF